MPGLSACPICRSNLDRFVAADQAAVTSCPDCGTSLEPYIDIKSNAMSYRGLAVESLSRGDLDTARTLVDSLSRLVSEAELPLSRLNFRIALAEGDLERAQQCLGSIDQPEHDALNSRLDKAREQQQLAREQFNYALACARDEHYELARSHISLAVDLDPHSATAWQLKLKIDLKAADFAACYTDLEQLDHLNSRPREYLRLESLLPPL